METVDCFSIFSPKKLGSFKSKNKPGSSSGSLKTPKSPNLSISPPLREEDLIREVFRRFDGDRDGKISPSEIRSYFASVGEHMSYEDAEGIISHLDTDNDNLIDFEDFSRLMDINGGGGGGGVEEDLRAAFGMFEWEKGSGRITAKGLQRVLARLGDPKSYEECVAMIRAFDSDGKGGIGYNQFQQMMMA